MMLTKYQGNIFNKIEGMPHNKWFIIEPTRADREDMIATLKLYIDIFGNLIEFNEHYTKFRRLEPLKIEDSGVRFEFHKREDVFIDYSHLEGNEPPKIGQKEWSKKAGRGN